MTHDAEFDDWYASYTWEIDWDEHFDTVTDLHRVCDMAVGL